MFLINKHTGEAIEWERNITYKVGKPYESLKEFLEDWEDATVISTRELEDLRRVYDDALRAEENPCEN